VIPPLKKLNRRFFQKKLFDLVAFLFSLSDLGRSCGEGAPALPRKEPSQPLGGLPAHRHVPIHVAKRCSQVCFAPKLAVTPFALPQQQKACV
jgi:hypothetical protein